MKHAYLALPTLAVLVAGCGPDRPTEAQVREVVVKSVDAWDDDAAFSLQEFEVRDWADVRPGLVRARVFLRCDEDSAAL